jgi:uroporphyrinogen-III synthase
VTRAAHQAGPTVSAFEGAGARVELLPLLEVVPPPDPAPLQDALAHLAGFGWIVLTSSNAVDQVLGRPGWPPTLPVGLRVASVGAATSEALRARGVEPDLEPANARAEGLAAALIPLLKAPGKGGSGRARVLLPQAADARPVLEEELRRAGADAVRVDAYAKRVPPDAGERARAIFGTARLGWVTFTSPSIARSFTELGAGLWGGDWPGRRRGLFAASIGPVTSDALRALGVEPAAEAASPSDEEMVAAVAGAVASRGLDRA